MEKLQYDNIYKFLVSVGVLMIIVPFVFFHFVFSGTYDLMVTQEEFNMLTADSAALLNSKMEIMLKVYTMFKDAVLFMGTVGLLILLYGCYKWYQQIQKHMDTSAKIDAMKKKVEYEKISNEEKEESERKEVLAQMEDMKNIGGKQGIRDLRNDPSCYISKSTNKAIQVEQLYFNSLQERMGDSYELHHNVKIDRREFDIIAESKITDFAIVYEVRYMPHGINECNLIRTCERFQDSVKKYKTTQSRHCCGIVVVVSIKKCIDAIKNSESILDLKEKYALDIRFIEERSLV